MVCVKPSLNRAPFTSTEMIKLAPFERLQTSLILFLSHVRMSNGILDTHNCTSVHIGLFYENTGLFLWNKELFDAFFSDLAYAVLVLVLWRA